eukprot:CAMPEP_0172008844 /NCGR_PEP_ID=MMETSP1041-20130122/6861_1 /TAXON_ID=464988 /ORGANISM="Hemiselmis andersenii, Strain CCMP439" /LENGTH=361 /DNA_ID=CAMNT_0012663061 /DNA_START=84 /DNA_END=1165 /DNA_ORIENTATION=-
MCKEGVEKTEDAPHKASHAGMVGGVDADLARTQHTAVYHRVSALLGQYVDGMGDRGKKVIKFASPAEILEVFGSVCADDGGAERERGASADEVVRLCELVLDYSVRTSSPLFFNQLYGRVDPVGLAADHVLSTLNTNAFTWEVAPVFTTLERALVRRLVDVFGLPEGAEGLFVPGGSMANMYGMHAARYAKVGAAVKREGHSAAGGQLVGFCSADAHYSYSKGANFMGIGTDNFVAVPVDHTPKGRGSMRADVLEEMVVAAKAEGKVPFMVGATSGTTVYGGFDDPVVLREVSTLNTNAFTWEVCRPFPPKTCFRPCRLPKYCQRVGVEKGDAAAWTEHARENQRTACRFRRKGDSPFGGT